MLQKGLMEPAIGRRGSAVLGPMSEPPPSQAGRDHGQPSGGHTGMDAGRSEVRTALLNGRGGWIVGYIALGGAGTKGSPLPTVSPKGPVTLHRAWKC